MYSSKLRVLSRFLVAMIIITSLLNPVPNMPFGGMSSKVLASVGESVYGSVYGSPESQISQFLATESTPIITPTPTATPVPDSYGNDFATAYEITVGTEYQGVIDVSADIDYFKFTTSVAGMYSIGTTGNADTTGWLYNQSQSYIDSDSNEGIGNNFYIESKLEANTLYYVRVDSGTLNTKYTLKVSKLAEDNDNDTNSATSLQLGTTKNSTMDYLKDQDYFEFTPSTTALYSIESTGSIDLTGYLHGVASEADISTSNKNFRIKAQLNANQTYYLQVYQPTYDKDSTVTGSYGIIVSSLADDYGSSFASAVQIQADTDYTVLGQAHDDVDMFKFVPSTSGMYAFESSGTSNTYATIYDVNGGAIHHGYDEGIQNNYYINHYLEVGKTYYIGTYSYSVDVSYTLKVYKHSDDYGNDSNSSTFIQVGDIVSGEVNYQNDYDYFRFVPAVSGPYIVESFGDTDVSGTISGETSSYDISTTNKNFKISHALNAGQTYYLYIYHANNSDKDYPGTGAYSFKISAGTDDHGNTFEAATPIETGAEIQAVNETSGDYDYFKFVPETSGMYGFESTGSSNTYCDVYDKNQSRITYDYDYGIGSNYFCPVWLDGNQTYYFRTSGSENVSYKVKVDLLADDHGHDSNTATALILDTLTSGEINFCEDYDYFKFTPTTTGPYVVESTGTTDVDGELTGYLSDSDKSSTDKNFKIAYTLNANQTYNIRVWHHNNWDKDYSNTGTYGIKVSKFSDDHGNTYDTATELEIGASLQAVQESNGDVDYFKVTTASAGMYSIESLGTANTNGNLYNSSNSSITHDYDYGVENNFYMPCWLEANSTYYIKSSGSTAGDTYQVKVSPLTDDHGHDESSATALTLNNEISGQIDFTGDYDYFKFTPTESGPYVMESTGTTDVDGYLVGYQSNSDISSTNRNFKITYSLNANQTYNIRVNHKYYYDKDYTNTTGGYGIKVTKLSDDHGSDPTTATLIQVGTDVKVVKECDGDEDYLKFVPTVSGMYSFESTGEADTYGQLFDSNKSNMVNDQSSGVKNNFYFTAWLDAGSTYYLRAYTYNIGVEFTVKVTALTDDCGNSNEKSTALTLNKELQCEINYAGDYDYFKFTPTVSGAYAFESTGVNDMEGWTSAYSASNSNTKNFKIACYLNANTTYYCYAKHHNTDKDYTCTGAYGVKITLLENSATPIQVGTDLNVTQTTGGNYMKFIPATSGMYIIESTGTSDTSAFLYDDRVYNRIAYDYDSGFGQNFYIKAYLTGGQVYYILPTSTNSLPYTVKVTALTDDHGHDNDSATTISVGSNISGSINFAGDYDYFKFVPTTSGPYVIESTGSTDVDGELTWYLSNNDIDVSNKNFRLAYTLTANQTYYIKVWHHNSDKDYTPNTGDYGINVTKLTDRFSDSIDSANLVDTQKLITTEIESVNDYDFVKFVPSTTGSYTIQSYGKLNVYGNLYNSSKQHVVGDDNSAGDNVNFKITYNLNANTTYYLRIYTSSNAVGQYSFAIFPGNDDHRNEINNASLVQVGVDAAGIFNYTGDEDCFRFSPAADGVYNIKSTGSLDTYCEIYDSIGNMLGSSDNASEEDLNFSITQSLLASRTCYIVIKNQNTENGLGSYTLKVTNTGLNTGDDFGNSFDTAGALTIGAEQAGKIDYASDIDFFKFTASTGGTYTIESTGSNNLIGYVYDQSRSSVAYDNDSGLSTNFYLPVYIEADKTYYVKVIHSSGSATGNYGIKVTSATDDHRNTNTNATILSIGSNIASSINYKGDIDVFKYLPTESGPVVFSLTGNGDVRLKVLDQNGVQIYSDQRTNSSVADLSVPIYLTAGQYYYFKVNHKDYLDLDNAGTGNYSVKLSAGSDDHGNGFDNSTLATANKVVSGNIESFGDEDMFKFVPTATSIYTITTTGTYDTVGYLYDDTKSLRISDDNSGVDNNFFIASTLTAGKTYYVKVTNASATGTGNYSFVVAADSVAPSAPELVGIASKSALSATLQWSAATDNVGVVGYNIYRGGTKIGTTSQLTYTDTVTSAGVYKYTIRAYDSTGNESANSREIVFDCEKPTVPAGVKASNNTVTTVDLSWSVSNDGTGTGIQNYNVYRDGTKIKTLFTTSYNDTSLVPNTSYSYQVTAVDNSGNESVLSSAIIGKTLADITAPSVPASLTVSSKTGTSITLKWLASTDDYNVEGYQIFRNGTLVGSTAALTYKDKVLTTGTSYSYVVKAYDKANNTSNASNSVSAIPLKPQILSVEPVAGTTVGGNTSRWFHVYFANSNNLEGTKAKFEYSADGTTWSDFGTTVYGPYNNGSSAYLYCGLNLTSLSSGTYKVRYTVTDEEGSFDKIEASYQIDRTSPNVPASLNALGVAGKVDLSWDIPVNNDVHHYVVYRSLTSSGTYNSIATISGAANNYYSDLNVTDGTTYYYKVTAVDTFGQESAYSNAVSAIPQVDSIIPVVLGIEPLNQTVLGPNAYITVRAQDNIEVSSIRLQYSTNGTTWNDIARQITTSNAYFNWSTVPLNGNVSVRAIVYDKSGNASNGTPVRNYVIDTQGPDKVTGLASTAHSTYVVLKWNDVSAQDFSYFMVEKKKDDGTFENVGTTSTTLGMNVLNLVPGKSYVFRVVAYDKFGNRGTVSDELTAVTLGDTTAPWITAMGPSPSSFTGKISLWASASDNANVASVKFQVSTNLTSWTDIATVTNSSYNANFTARYDYDVSGLSTGKIYIRPVALDAAGLTSKTTGTFTYAEYVVDHTGPAAPSGVYVEPEAGLITLKWQKNAETDLKSYKVYRGENVVGPFTMIAQDVDSLGYRDRSIDQTKTYYYQISAVDIAGNEGAKSATISAKATADTEAPKIAGIWPDSGKTLSANPQISVVAYDNLKLKNLTVEIKKASDTAGTWTTVLNKALSTYNENVTFTLDTSALFETTYTIRATATDEAGNVSEIKTASYDFNLTPPTKPAITAKAGGWKVDLTWERAAEPDLAGYRIYRSTTSGGTYQMIKEINADSYSDTSVTPGIAYYYVVDAIDTFRNTNRSTESYAIPTSEDNIAPVAVAGSEQTTTTNLPVYFDGTLSKDNNRIAEYMWDFGDGSSSIQSQPSHIYASEGIYTVKLTVKDPAGNANSATTTVTVKPAAQVGVVEVKVIDNATGSPLGAASVVVEYADGTRYNTVTNGSGFVNVTVPAGDCKVYAYKTDYKPNYIAAKSVVGTKSTVTVGLESGQLVVGELTVKRMTLDQIKDAGIDVTAPENNWVYKFEVHLAFQNRPLPVQTIIVNGNGGLLGGGGFYIPSPGGGYYAYPKPIPIPNHPEIRPTIAYLVIPGEARFLKEFFEVQLALENTADPVFVIEQSKAVLTLPDGLALATTREAQSLEVNIGDFKGGEKKEVKWIIRGDKKGMYTLQADFTGILQPFGEKISATFKNKEAFRVWGDDALKMHIYAQDKVDKGYPYDIRFELENVSDIPVYYSTIELLEANKQNYFYAPNQELVESVETLKAGEKLVKTYTLVPSITGDLVLNASYVLKTGGNATIESFIHPISVPENMLNVAPKVTETQNGNVVTLSWEAVEGATGYKIYSVRKDRYMAKDPGELIATLPAGTLTYNITETTGTKDYIVTTLSASGEKMRHAIAWPDVGDPAPAVVTVNPSTIEVGKASEVWITVNNNGKPVIGGTVNVGSYYTGVVLDSNGQAKVFVNPTEAKDFTVTAYDASHNKLVDTIVKVVSIVLKPIGYIDLPKVSQTCNGKVDVRGWFLDQSGVSKVEVFVDGVFSGTAVYGDSRPDVKTVYPYYNNANSGYHYALDTSKLSPGNHTLSIRETSKTNVQTLLNPVSINVVLNPIGYIDSPKASQTCNGKVDVNGWFLDQSGVSKVEVFVDGVSSGIAVYGDSRPDVKTVYPYYNNANSGFHYVLDTTNLSKGTHSVKVCGTGKNGTVTTIGTVSIVVLPSIGCIDSPKVNATVREKVNLFGWILDPNGVSKVEVLVDNLLVGTAIYGDSRSDVKLVYPLYNNAKSGFHYTLDTSKLSEGKHTITIREISNKVDSIMLIKKVDIMVSKLPVKGWLDNPTGSTALTGKTSMWGWFLDISGVSKVNILVDDVLIGQAVYGDTRNDVFAAYPQYNNKSSGFHYLLDTLKLSNGKHTLKVVEIGVHGEQSIIQKDITISN